MKVLRNKFKNELIEAMKVKDTIRVSTLRLILAAIKDRDLESRRKGQTYYPCESNSNYQTTIPNHQGKFLYKSRLP